jgi:hypothetical protein
MLGHELPPVIPHVRMPIDDLDHHIGRHVREITGPELSQLSFAGHSTNDSAASTQAGDTDAANNMLLNGSVGAVTDSNQRDGDPELDMGNDCQGTLAHDVLAEIAPLPADDVIVPIAAINHVATGGMAVGDHVLLGRGAHTPRAGALGANAATPASEVPTALADGDTMDMNAPGTADTPTTV